MASKILLKSVRRARVVQIINSVGRHGGKIRLTRQIACALAELAEGEWHTISRDMRVSVELDQDGTFLRVGERRPEPEMSRFDPEPLFWHGGTAFYAYQERRA